MLDLKLNQAQDIFGKNTMTEALEITSEFSLNLASLMARVLPVESGVYLKIDHQGGNHYDHNHDGKDDIMTIIIIMIKMIIIIF